MLSSKGFSGAGENAYKMANSLLGGKNQPSGLLVAGALVSHHVSLSVGLLEYLNGMTIGFPQSK